MKKSISALMSVANTNSYTRHGLRAMREMLCGVDRHAGVIRCRYRRIATAAENRYQPKGQSISPDGTGGFMTEQEKAFEEALMARQQLSRHTGDRETAKPWFISGYAAGERAARQQFTPLYKAVNELMAYMGAHGSAEARGDRAQAVMDALHAIDGGQYREDL
jgi:hypothetical protein